MDAMARASSHVFELNDEDDEDENEGGGPPRHWG